MIEIASADAGRALPQQLHRTHHPSADEQACQDGHAKAEQEENGGSEDGGIQRSIGLSGWSLDQHRPPQVGDGSRGREHLLAGQVGLSHRQARPASQGSLHLRQIFDAALLQDQADVGMSDQVAVTGHHIDIPRLSYLDA